MPDILAEDDIRSLIADLLVGPSKPAAIFSSTAQLR